MKLSLRKMKFFKKRDKAKPTPDDSSGSHHAPHNRNDSFDHAPDRRGSYGGNGYGGYDTGFHRDATLASARLLQTLPENVLGRIFSYVCPHSLDRTYEKCEESSHGNSCMLCDMRDLANCVRVCRRWRPVAEQVLFTSIRIDTVHYCEREAFLAEKRKRRYFFDRNAEPEDTADARLKLLCRGLRDDPTQRLGRYVEFLKIPYMLRESHRADIARAISLMPNLRYVDLPEGLFMDDPVYIPLKVEVQAKCPDLRKMTYISGSERSLEGLASGMQWPNLEVLDLVKVNMDPAMMRHVLASLGNLRALKVTETATGPHAFSDDVLLSVDADDYHMQSEPQSYAMVPPLTEIVLTNTQRLTADGLMAYLQQPQVASTLRVLTLSGTGVKPWTLQSILSLAPALEHITIVDEVTVALPIAAGTKDISPLESLSLKTLNYEITAAPGVSPYAGVTRSYYNYLSGSILSGGMPSLRAVYVRDAQFPDSLLSSMPLPPPPGASFGDFGGSGNRRPMSSSAAAPAMNSHVSTGSLSLGPRGLLSPGLSPGFPPQGPGAAGHRKSTSFQGRTSFGDGALQSPTSPPGVLPRPPKPWATAGGGVANPRFSSNNPFAGMISPQQMQTLEVFTKGDDDLDWSSIVVSGHETDIFGGDGGAGGTGGRPMSSYGLGADMGAAGARKSVLINMGPGGFLALPEPPSATASSHGRRDSHSSFRSVAGGGGGGGGGDAWPRPMSSSSRRENRDLWR